MGQGPGCQVAHGPELHHPPPRVPRPPPSVVEQRQQRTKKVEAKLSDGDVRGAIRLITSDDIIAPNNEDTWAALITKHLPHPEPASFPDPPTAEPLPPIEDDQLLAGIASFPPGTAGGLDGLRPQILKDLFSLTLGEDGKELVKATKALLDIMLKGEVPASICPIFYDGSLTALLKKTGGIRPVAVGNAWRRLLSKIVVRRMMPELVDYLAPHQ